MDWQLDKWIGFLIVGLVAAARLNAAEPDPEISSVLQHWQAASEDRGLDGLTVRVLQSFLGPMREDSLRERFTWSQLSLTEVQAVPSDPFEQQFLPTIRISLDDSALPQSVTIGEARHEVRDLVRAQLRQVASRESVARDSGIVRVSFNNEGETNSKPAINVRASEVLTRWVAASKTANAVRATFRRADYDSATEVETHSTGTFVFTAPYAGLYHAEPDNKVAAESARIGLDSQPYAQLPGQEIMLMWDGGKLTQIDVPSQRYEVHQLPGSAREFLCGGSFDSVWQTLIAPQSALPMVVALQEKELQANYDWSLVADDQQAIILHGTPVSGADSMLYQSAQIVIDPATFRTRATRMLDITGTKETVHEFSIQLAAKNVAELGGWQPDLSGYLQFGDIPGVEPASFVQKDLLDLPPAPPASLPPAE